MNLGKMGLSVYDFKSAFVEQQQGAPCVSSLSLYLETRWARAKGVRTCIPPVC
jgi:hypothetical protein